MPAKQWGGEPVVKTDGVWGTRNPCVGFKVWSLKCPAFPHDPLPQSWARLPLLEAVLAPTQRLGVSVRPLSLCGPAQMLCWATPTGTRPSNGCKRGSCRWHKDPAQTTPCLESRAQLSPRWEEGRQRNRFCLVWPGTLSSPLQTQFPCV